MNRKKILITGSNGFLGQKLIELLVNTECDLIATSRGENRCLVNSGYEYESIDIVNHAGVEKVFLRHRPDYVIHTAALTNADTCEADPERAEALNVTATKNIAQLCRQLNAHLIHISTDFVFDGLGGPYRETDVAEPVNNYGRSKLASEQMVEEFAGKWAIIRTILVYGLPADRVRSNFVLWVKSELEKGQTIKVVNDQWRMPTSVDDLAWSCLAVIDKKAEGLFHIAGRDALKICDMAYEVASYWKLSTDLIVEVSADSLHQTAARPKKTGFLLEKAKLELGFIPRTFREGLSLMDEQMRKRGN